MSSKNIILILVFTIVLFSGSVSLGFSDTGYGTVESSIKITGNSILSSNNTQTVAFEDGDRMGISITNIDDFDGDGVPDIVIGMGGAHTYHISEGDRAMNILLMNSDGTVKAQRAITYDAQGLPDGCYNSASFDKSDIGFGEKITWLGSLIEGLDPVLMVASVDEGASGWTGNVYALSLKYNSDDTVSPVTACTRINEGVGGFNPLTSDNYPTGDTYFGYPIENAGDLNDDGVTDVYVGVDNGYRGIGATEFYILYLQQNSTTSAVTVKDHQRLPGIHTNVTNNSIIDDMIFLELDGDTSTTEIAFSASGVFGGPANKVYIGSFNDDFTLSWNSTISELDGHTFADNDEFGESLVNLGDIDGDGITDIVVGSENDYSDKRELGLSGNEGHGALYVLFMNNNGTVKDYQQISNLHGNLTDGTTTNEYWSNVGAFGAGLSYIDLDADGVDELIATSMDDDSNGSNSGAFYILELNVYTTSPVTTDGTIDSYTKITSNTIGSDDSETIGYESGDLFGYKTTNMGDLDGNGAEDFATIAFAANENFGNTYLVLMNTDGTVKESHELSNCATNDETRETRTFGESLDYLGLIDGKHVLLISDYWFNTIHALSIDSADYTHTCSDITVNGLEGLGWPFSVVDSFDVDGIDDSVPDLIVGVNNLEDNGSDLYVLDLDLDDNSNITVTSQIIDYSLVLQADSTWDKRWFENSVIADIDGDDSTIDLVLGEPRPDSSIESDFNGNIHVAFVDKSSFAITAVTTMAFNDFELDINGPSDAHFGIGLANMGDLDGDTIDDIAVGIEGADIVTANSGAVAIMFLNADGSMKEMSLIANSESGGPLLQELDLFGKGLEAVDIDGNGFPELVASAHQDDTGGNNAGAIYILTFNQDESLGALNYNLESTPIIFDFKIDNYFTQILSSFVNYAYATSAPMFGVTHPSFTSIIENYDDMWIVQTIRFVEYDSVDLGIVIDSDIMGDQIVESNETLTITGGATVTGNIIVNNGTLILEQDSTVEGKIISKDSTVLIDDSTVTSSVIVKGGTISITNSFVEKRVKVTNSTFVVVTSNEITGNLKIVNSSDVSVSENTIGKSLRIKISSDVTLDNNQVGKNIRLVENNDISVNDNHSDKNIKFVRNTNLTQSNNIADGKIIHK